MRSGEERKGSLIGFACKNTVHSIHLESSGLRWRVVAADSAIPVRRMVRAERASAWE